MTGDPDDPRLDGAPEVDGHDPRIARVDGQERRDRAAHPGGDQALHRLVVVRAERPLRLDPRGAERGFDWIGRGAGAKADERLLRDLAQRRRPLGERRAGGHDEHVRVAQQLDRRERRVSDREQHEADVELAALECVRDLLVVVLLEHHLDLRPLRGEAPHDLRQYARARRLEGADAQRPRLAGAQRLQVGVGSL